MTRAREIGCAATPYLKRAHLRPKPTDPVPTGRSDRHPRPSAAWTAAVLAVILGALALALLVMTPMLAPIDRPEDPDAWYLALVNDSHPLPEDFSIETASAGGDEVVDARIVEPLNALLDAGEQAGYYPFVRSGYRTRAQQEEIFTGRVQEYEAAGMDSAEAREVTEREVARPGTSEHELGLAVDINDATNDPAFYDWIAEHAHEYGFILRYPADKTAVTGIEYESWHFRYVGEKAATTIYRHNLALEEYLELAP